MFFSGYVGGESYRNIPQMRERNPEFIISHAVKGMLPKSKLGKTMAKKLKVYADGDHRHSAQKPEAVTI